MLLFAAVTFRFKIMPILELVSTETNTCLLIMSAIGSGFVGVVYAYDENLMNL